MGDFSDYPEAIADTENLPIKTAHVDIVTAADHNAQSGFIRDITKTLGINPHGTADDLATRLSSVISPVGIWTPPAQTVTVAKSGGMFTTIQAAINSITDASASKVYSILVYPGIYEENITLKPYVNISEIAPKSAVLQGSATLSTETTAIVSFNLPINTDQNNALNLSGANLTFYLFSNVYTSADTAVLLANYVFAAKEAVITSNMNAVNSSASILYLKNCSLKTMSDNSAAYQLIVTGGNNFLAQTAFYNINSDYSIYSSTSSICWVFGCIAYKTKHANVNTNPSTHFSVSVYARPFII